MNERYLQIHCSSRSQDGVWVCVCVYPSDPGLEGALSDDMEVTDTTDSGLWDDGMVKERTIDAADCLATRPTWQAETTSWHFISSLKKGQYRTLSCTKIVMIMFYDHFPPLPDTEWPLLWLANQAMRIRFVHKENKNNEFIKQFASSSYVARVMRRRWIVE